MSVREIVVALLLGVGVLIELLCAVGVLVMRNPFDRLHYLAPATTLGPLAIALALVIAEGDAATKIKGGLIALLLLTTGPVLTHATARAAWTRMHGRLDAVPRQAEEQP